MAETDKKSQIQAIMVIGGMLIFLLVTYLTLSTGNSNIPSEVRERLEKKK